MGRLLGRVTEQAGLSDLPLRLEIAGGQDAGGGSCSSGSCCGTSAAPAGRFQRVRSDPDGEGYVVTVAAQEVGNDTVLTTAFVRAVSHLFLLEADLYADFERAEYEPAVDVAGALLGFGVLLANGSYLYSKGCGSVSIQSATKLPVQEIATALAVFCELHKVHPRSIRGQLEATPRAHFDEASLWARSNAGTVKLLRSDRTAFEADSYSLHDARSWVSRLFGLGRAKSPSVPTDDELDEVARSLQRKSDDRDVDPEKQRRLAEIRELVDDALDS